jgi:cyanophycinase
VATTVFLMGGGWEPAATRVHVGAFLAATRAVEPTVACVVLDEGDGAEQYARWEAALVAVGPCRPVPVLVPLGGRLDPAALGDADALLVCGGLTPAYAAALGPAAGELRAWLAAGDRPYAGFSAGAAVAATRAVVGGWRSGGVPVCPEEASEDLDEVTVSDGLGLVPFAVEVHCAQWGTLPRLVTAVSRGEVPAGVALDEGAMLRVEPDGASVVGPGRAWRVAAASDGVHVEALTGGRTVTFERS